MNIPSRFLAVALFSTVFLMLPGAGCVTQPLQHTTQAVTATIDESTAGSEVANRPEPLWISRYPVKELENSIMIGFDGLLIQSVELAGFSHVWEPQAKDLILYNLKDGSIRWTIPKNLLPKTIDQIIPGAEAVYITGKGSAEANNQLIAVDVETGAVLWQREPADRNTRITPLPQGGVALFTSCKQGELAVAAVGLKDGKDVWSSKLKDFADPVSGEHSVLALLGDGLIVGRGLARLSLGSGETLWSVPFTQSDGKSFIMELEKPYLVLSDGAGVQCLDPESGQANWKLELSGMSVPLIHLQKGKLFLAYTDEGTQALKRLDPASGNVVWEKKLAEKLRSPMSLHTNGTLFFSTRDRLYALDGETGEQRFAAELPEFLRSPTGLPDQVVVADNKVIVSREVGIAAYPINGGAAIFQHAVDGSLPFTNAYLSHKLAARAGARAKPGDRSLAPMNAATNFVVQSAAQTMAQSQMNLDFTMMQTQSVLSSPTSSSSERKWAITQREIAIQSNYATQLAAARTQATMAGINAMMSVVALSMGIREGWVRGSLGINDLQAQMSHLTHQRTLQSGYYLRPFYANGWGVTLVRLSDGKRADLLLAADNGALCINGANVPLLLVSPDGKNLIAKGLEPHPKEYYTKLSWTPDYAFFPTSFQIPYAALMAFELEKINFTEAGPGGRTALKWPTLSDQEQELLDAAYLADAKKVKELIGLGVNVNAKDAYGYNALFYASIVDSKKVVNLLLKSGCDARARDSNRWLPYHYNLLTIANCKSASILARAGSRKSESGMAQQ